MNELHFGDNLDVLRGMPAESVDLIYLDPPFNSNADYGLLYGTRRGGPSQAQAHAFDDMWTWGPDAQEALRDTAARHMEAGALLDAFEKLFRASDMMAYLAMMSVRLIEMHRVLKSTGSLYLHCDSTASHYLKMLLDAIFGPLNFKNEIIWQRTGAHNDAKRWGRVTDTVLFYSKSSEYTFNPQFTAYDPEYVAERYRYKDESTGRLFWPNTMTAAGPGPARTFRGVEMQPPTGTHWRFSQKEIDRLEAEGGIYYSKAGKPYVKSFLDERKGRTVQSLWTDIVMSKSGAERLGYPTQKPLALLERIILASTNEGDVVLDPFCGCGTAVEAAEKLKRRWIGIDVTYLAVHVIETRLQKAFGSSIKNRYRLFGRPEDADDARALAARDWLEFQKWAVMMLGGLPKDRPGPDGGIDGIIRYHRVGIEQPNRAVVSVKGGMNVGVDAIHKLKSVVHREKAEIGVLVCLERPTAPMVAEALSADKVGPASKRVYALQIVTVDDLFKDTPVNIPGIIDLPEVGRAPVFRTPTKGRKKATGQGELLLPIGGGQEPVSKPNKRSIRPVDIEVVRPLKQHRATK